MQNNLYYQDEYVKERFNLRMLLRLLRSASKHKNYLWGSVALEVTTSLLSLVPSILYSVIVATLFPSSGELAENYLLVILLAGGGFASVWIGLAFLYYLENTIPGKLGYLFSYELRAEIFHHVTGLSFHYFDTHSTGKILVRVTNYVDELADLFADFFYHFMYCVCVSVIGIITMLVLDIRIGGMVVLALIPLFILMFFLSRAIHKRAGVDRNKNANYTAFVAENISGAEVVQAYNRGKLNGKVASDLYTEYSKAFMRTTRVREAFFPLSNGFTNAIIVLVVYGTAMLIGLTGGALSLATVIAIGSVLGEVTSSIGDVCTQLSSVFTLTTNLERVYDTIETPVDVCDREGAREMKECKGDVAFENVDFSYVEGIPVLKNFTLTAKAGETVALVGATGSGKTTVVNLLSRFYDVQKGHVKVDGSDVREFTLRTLRERVGAMMQDTYLFSGTVLDNIRFARPEATDEECIRASKAACADGFIRRLPKGYETEISEGYALSGGERQLLSFARLILADPRIIVLDEATSHIDTQTELEVQKSLKNLLAGRTSFVIAHRLSTIREADQIVFIENGEIVERGTHEELLRLGGNYAKMIASAAI